MRWKILYRNGDSFTDRDGPPEAAPGGGIVAIAQEDDRVGLLIHEGHVGIYVWDEELYGGWYNLDWFGFVQYLLRPGKKVIKLGEVIPTGEYLEILDAFRKDPGFPSKSARYEWERPMRAA